MKSNAVQAEDLVLGYGSTVALSKSSFAIPAGKVTAVIGPNGSGKSTLLSAVAGLIDPISGSIEVLAGTSSSHRIAYVLQTTKVNDALPISVREVVMMGRYAGTGAYRRLDQDDRDAVAEAMERTGITDLAGRHLSDLSGGQLQRVFVAQGLAQEHDLLLLDEPLTGIDFPTAQAIDFVIHDELARGCTVVMTTHDLSEAQVADNVLLLSGRVVAHGSPTDDLTTEHLKDAYGAALLHVEDGRVFLDDAAHRPVEGRHVHRDRIIHTESSQSDLHKE
ncbi:MAG: zinc ABC transporter ATP-binding protein AztA [Actinobacteria bacterium]|nr:zinc ABC transporter ATP-binding protein AztA [Actinomycetota bacterium]